MSMGNPPFGFDPYGRDREQLRQLVADNERLREHIKRLTGEKGTFALTTIIGVVKKKRAIRFVLQQAIQEAILNEDSELLDQVKLGRQILVEASTLNPVRVLADSEMFETGGLCTVKQIVEKKPVLLVEIQVDTATRVVPSAVEDVKAGDRCVLDFSGYVLIKNLGSKDTSHVLGSDMLVTFDDIGGQESAKRALLEAIVEPHKKASLYKRFNMSASKGVLLWGPPGTGKTMLAKAAANALAKLHGKSAMSSAFIYVKGPELLSKWLGESEANIRKLFAQARAHFEEHGYPAIIFVDEADALLGRRGSMHPGFEGVDRTIVPQFLSEMDGLQESGAFVLLATNRPDILDPAVVRDGRINRKVHVSRPDQATAAVILKRLLDDKPCKGTSKRLADEAAAELYSDKHHMWDVLTDKKSVIPIYLRTLASGALIAGVAERASQHAIRADAHEIDSSHLMAAIAEVVEEQKRLTHDLNDFMDAIDGTIVDMRKPNQLALTPPGPVTAPESSTKDEGTPPP